MEISQFLEELDPEFLESLYKLDEREALRVQLEGCPRCGGQLDRADYWRKPRGVSGLERHLSRRHSFCCRECRRRVTPASTRFLGRKVYLEVVVLVVSYLRQKAPPVILRRLSGVSGASIETISRWQHWWEEVVAEHPLWRFWRGRFVPPLGTRQIVRSMFDRFSSVASGVSETVHRVSKFLSPLTLPANYPC